ncbi:MAG: hypothetical protein KGL99_14870 [Burkholderiales bacterium]|nr:hypothetical protein [Burkholderiales bacterium]
MNSLHPREIVSAGSEALLTVLGPQGFSFEPGEEGKGSGGLFAQGRLTRGNRILEFSFRYGLGEVMYEVEGNRISHENYLKYSGNWSKRKYPDFGTTPEQSFSALAQDIKEYFADFAGGSGEEFKSIVAACEANPNKFKGFGALPE